VSGGSFDYMSSEMAEGRVEKFVTYVDDMLEELEAVLKALEEGDQTISTRTIRPGVGERCAHPSPELAIIAVNSAIQRVRRTKAIVDEVREIVPRLAALAHAVEWCRSGDTGKGNVADACIKDMCDRLGIDRAQLEKK